MANSTTNLSKLRIILAANLAAVNSITSAEGFNWQGVMIFNEADKTIHVRGNVYASDAEITEKLGLSLDALVTAGYLEKDGNTYTAVQGATNVATMILEKIGTLPGGATTVAQAIGTLPTGATTVAQAITDSVSALETKVGEVPTGFAGGITTGATTVVQAINQLDANLTAYEQTANAAIETLQTGLNNLTEVVQGASGLVSKVTALETGLTAAQSAISELQTGLSAAQSALETVQSQYVKTVNGADGVVTITVNGQGADSTSIEVQGVHTIVGGGGYASGTNVAQAIAQLDERITNVDTDSFVQSGSLVWGAATGIEGSYSSKKDVKTAKESGYETPYLELIIKEIADPDTVLRYTYIAATSLFNDYTGTGTATITVNINGSEISATLNNDSIQAAHIQAAQVTTAKIADFNVTDVKLATGAVTETKIADFNVTNAKLATGAVTVDKMAADSVNTAQMVNSAVTRDKIAAQNVTYDKLATDVASQIIDEIGTSTQSASNQGIQVSVSSEDGKLTGVTVSQEIISWEVVEATGA